MSREPKSDERCLLVERRVGDAEVHVTPTGVQPHFSSHGPGIPATGGATTTVNLGSAVVTRHFAHAWFRNEPDVEGVAGNEPKVAAHLTFLSADGQTRLIADRILGRWTHLDQVEKLRAFDSKVPLETTDFDANGIERELDIVAKFTDDAECYARHAYDAANARDPGRAIRETDFLVKVEIESARIKCAVFWFHVTNLGASQGVQIKPAHHNE
jgi:hypothetical protein